jgi:hypothetical protein
LESSSLTAVAHRLKHKHTTDIVLVPQPTDDPNDPLNWSTWKRSLAFTSICAFTFVASWALGGFGPGILLVLEDFQSDLNATVHGIVSWVVLTIGLAVCPSGFD